MGGVCLWEVTVSGGLTVDGAFKSCGGSCMSCRLWSRVPPLKPILCIVFGSVF